jgi:hypothetical protein
MSLKYFAAFIVLAIANCCYACKTRPDFDSYPLDELKASDILIEAQISDVEPYSEDFYPGAKSFKATILQSFRGNLSLGSVIEVSSAKEHTNGVCPVLLSSGQTYLLVITQHGGKFAISRFNVIVEKEAKDYKKYVEQISLESRPRNT